MRSPWRAVRCVAWGLQWFNLPASACVLQIVDVLSYQWCAGCMCRAMLSHALTIMLSVLVCVMV